MNIYKLSNFTYLFLRDVCIFLYNQILILCLYPESSYHQSSPRPTGLLHVKPYFPPTHCKSALREILSYRNLSVIKRFVRASHPTVVQFRRSLAPFVSSQCQVRSSPWGYHSLRQCSFHVVEGDVTSLANRLGRLRGPAPHETDVCHLLHLSSALWSRQTPYVTPPNRSRKFQLPASKIKSP